MKWSIEIKKKALNELFKISKNDRVKIEIFLNETLKNLDNPRQYGRALEGNLKVCGVTEWVIIELFAIFEIMNW